jgi:hypothetical protein
MSETKHTPNYDCVCGCDNCAYIKHGLVKRVADLLAALEAVLEAHECDGAASCPCHQGLDAIAKAKGDSMTPAKARTDDTDWYGFVCAAAGYPKPPCETGCRPECSTCGRAKAPVGRSVPGEAAAGICTSTNRCPGYYEEPKPCDLWPGEERAR